MGTTTLLADGVQWEEVPQWKQMEEGVALRKAITADRQ